MPHKAVGSGSTVRARPDVWIVDVFLILVGGLIGLAIGVMGTFSMSLTAEDLALCLWACTTLVAVGFATGAGLSFGVDPAMRALRLQPVDAIRQKQTNPGSWLPLWAASLHLNFQGG